MIKFHEDAHIDLKICHFLQAVVSITEGSKNKIMRKSGIHSSVPCWYSTLEKFLFFRVSGKMQKAICFEATVIAQYQTYQNNTSAIKERPKEASCFSIIFGHPAKQKLF